MTALNVNLMVHFDLIILLSGFSLNNLAHKKYQTSGLNEAKNLYGKSENLVCKYIGMLGDWRLLIRVIGYD